MSSEEVRYAILDTRFGPAAVVTGSAGLLRVRLPGLGRRELRARIRGEFPDAAESRRGLARACGAVERFFATGRTPGRAIPLDLEGVGPFRRAVYDALRETSRGETVTYAELARRIGRPGAHRSVGSALARNPVPLFVPCHRVLRGDGGLGGFTAEGGIELKRKMLALELV
jgi:O-6-methylguanine DNA methyltransferase